MAWRRLHTYGNGSVADTWITGTGDFDVFKDAMVDVRDYGDGTVSLEVNRKNDGVHRNGRYKSRKEALNDAKKWMKKYPNG